MLLVYRFFIFLCLFLSNTSFLWSFEPSRFLNQGSQFYLEILSYEKFLQAVKNFAIRYRGHSGTAEWQMMMQGLHEKLGLRLDDFSAIQKKGFDTTAPIGLAVYPGTVVSVSKTRIETENLDIAVVLPATNARQLFRNYSQLLQKGTKSKVQVIQPGKLMKIKQKHSTVTYIARGSSYICLTSQLPRAQKCKGYVGRSIYRTLALKKIKQYSQNKNTVAIYLLDPESVLEDVSFLSDLLNADEEFVQRKVQELEKRIYAYGGSLNIKENTVQLKVDTFFKSDTLNDPNLWVNQLRVFSVPLTRLDAIQSPLLYMVLQINYPKLIELLQEWNPKFKSEIDKIEQDFRKQLNISFTQELLPALTGHCSAYVKNLPEENQITAPQKYNFVLGCGIKKGQHLKFIKLLQSIKTASLTESKIQGTVTPVENGQLFVFEETIPAYKSSKRFKPKKEVVAFLVTPQAVFFSMNPNHLKTMPPISKTSNSQRDLSQDLNQEDLSPKDFFLKKQWPELFTQEKQLYFYFYLNLSDIVNYISQTSYRFFIGPYFSFVAPLSSLQIYGFVDYAQDKDSSIIELRIK